MYIRICCFGNCVQVLRGDVIFAAGAFRTFFFAFATVSPICTYILELANLVFILDFMTLCMRYLQIQFSRSTCFVHFTELSRRCAGMINVRSCHNMAGFYPFLRFNLLHDQKFKLDRDLRAPGQLHQCIFKATLKKLNRVGWKLRTSLDMPKDTSST